MKGSADVAARKLIDRLAPARQPGDPLVGVLATTYEMQPEFVDTDLLPTIFALGAWSDRSWSSRIQVEQRLAQLSWATIYQEADRYRGRPRSLRMEIVPVSRTAGALHAKITLLLYDRSIRLVVGSANLTEPGYRKNREVVAVLSASESSPEQARLIREALEPLPELFGTRWTDDSARLRERALEMIEGWTAGRVPQMDEWFLWGGGERDPLWRQVTARWPAVDRVDRVTIVSPFWSNAADAAAPLQRLLGELEARGALGRTPEVRLLTEAQATSATQYRPVLPERLASFDARTLGVKASVFPVDPTATREETGGVPDTRLRPLHAKVVLLEGKETSLAYVGSANFTRRGWGFVADSTTANIEAGVLLRRSGRHREELRRHLVPGTVGPGVPLDGSAASRVAAPESIAPPERPWPSFLLEATLAPLPTDSHHLGLVVRVATPDAPARWSVNLSAHDDQADEVLVSVSRQRPSDSTLRVALSPDQLKRLIAAQEVLVRWNGHAREFPLNVEASARAALPIAPGGGQPGEYLLLQYYQSRIAFEDLFPPPPGYEEEDNATGGRQPDDEESGVDTSRIQSYQIREFVEALRGIEDDLHRATGSAAAMRQALLGPVSPLALARTIENAAERDVRSATAAAFQLVELIACLERALAFDIPDRLRPEWRARVADAIRGIEALLAAVRKHKPLTSRDASVFGRYESAVRLTASRGGKR